MRFQLKTENIKQFIVIFCPALLNFHVKHMQSFRFSDLLWGIGGEGALQQETPVTRVIVLSYLQPRISSVRFRGFSFPTALERSVRLEERGSVSPAPAELRIPGGRRTGGGMKRLSGEHTLSVGYTEAVGRSVCVCVYVCLCVCVRLWRCWWSREPRARLELQQKGRRAMRCWCSRAFLPARNDGLHLYCHD